MRYSPVFGERRLATYPEHYVCFACRKMFKQRVAEAIRKGFSSWAKFRELYRPPCPECSAPMLNMGMGFRPPRQADLRRWLDLEAKALAGVRYWYVPSWL